ncbi:putative zinc-containing dehydrogenase [Caballeronia udeis]|uniref:Putative zinc-containing dehydrogenase n=1 Tax=Caballeronia udeis TaxID=1232866 RepID=A0A158H1G7_9BURK|nr:putative zinc-containing dehydrogenase [Caballeronia udeis]
MDRVTDEQSAARRSAGAQRSFNLLGSPNRLSANSVGDEGNRVLLMTGQAHGKHRFCLVGPCFNVAAMSLGNLAGDIQPKSRIAVRVVFVLLIRASPERLKNPVQGLLLNGDSAVLHLETNFLVRRGHNHPYRRVWRSVLDRIQDQVAEQLLQPSAVPNTLRVSHPHQIYLVIRVRCSHQVQFIGKQTSQVDVGRRNIDTQTQYDLLHRIQEGQIDPSFVITHTVPLEGGPGMYKTFRDKEDGCIKVVLKP